MMLPVGGFEKPAIRRMAAGLGLRVAEKKDSQEICFVTRGRYDEFVRGRGDGGDGRRAGDDATARSSASTTASKASPSGSGRGWASRSATASSSCGSSPRRGAW